MLSSTSEGEHGVQWTAWMRLDDLDFTGDLSLLSHTHQQMQMKTTSVAAASASVGLNMHKGKSYFLNYNTENTKPITIDGGTLEEVETFVITVTRQQIRG
ncbi:unnamed protein product [Schistosoma margrebowiei]|uniref:Uncharacterized protein n=1 Tax=Schistosoma margrebowiei TaxID=48269 RepID=A0A183MKH4_9TREM|nr:unnamed protein product [Schistosoma margrebowiei]